MAEPDAPNDENTPRLDAPHPNGKATAPNGSHARRLRRRLFVIGGALIAVAWIVAIVYSVTAGSRSPERLDHAAARAVEAACRDARMSLQDLPAVAANAPGAARADRIGREDDAFDTMVARLREVQPTGSTPGRALRGWSDDWVHVGAARERYARDLGRGERARLVLPATGGIKPVTERMDNFVREQHHRIDECFTQSLQIEVVEGPRTYGKVDG